MKSFSIISLFFLAITALALPQPKPITDDTIASPLERKNFEPGYDNKDSWGSEAPAYNPAHIKPTPIKDNNNWGGHDDNPWQPSKPTLPFKPEPTLVWPHKPTNNPGWPQQPPHSQPAHSQPPTWTTLPKPSHWQPEPPKTTEMPTWPAWPPAKPTTTTTSSQPVMTVPAGWEWGKHNGWKGGKGEGGKSGWKRGEGVDGWVVDHLLGEQA